MFRHVGIVVKSLKKQLKFYQDILGLEIYYHKVEKGEFIEHILGGFEDMEGIEVEIVKLGKHENTIIELLNFKTPYNLDNTKLLYDFGYTHFAITVDNIDELAKKVKILNKPKINPEGTFKVCFCKDPEGNYIELVQCISNPE